MTRFDTPANRYASLAFGSFELTAKACKVTVVADPCRCGKTNGPQIVKRDDRAAPRACTQQRHHHGRSSITQYQFSFYRSTHD